MGDEAAAGIEGKDVSPFMVHHQRIFGDQVLHSFRMIVDYLMPVEKMIAQ